MRKLFIILLSLTLLACTKESSSKIEVIKLAESIQSWDGDTLKAYPQGQPQVTILKITIPPHTKLSMHKHPYINAGVLTKGNLVVTNEQEHKKYLKEGEALIELVETFHYGRNEEDEPAEIIVVYAGIENMPITILQGDSLGLEKHHH